MFTWNKGGVWMLRVWSGQINLRLPLPVYVLADLIDSFKDLCAVALPLFGLPDYALLLGELVDALDAPPGEPLVAVEAGGVRISLARMFDK